MNITLIKEHTHAGALKSPGERLDLSPQSAQWLINRGVARHTTPADLATAAQIIEPEASGDPSDSITTCAANDVDATAGA